MCYNRLPNLSDYWSSNSSMGNQFTKNAISRNRFQILMSKLYFNHPEKPDNATKLHYVEELVICMKQTFSNAMSESSHQSIDESMVKFKGRSVLTIETYKKGSQSVAKVWCTNWVYFWSEYLRWKNWKWWVSEGILGERVVTKFFSTIKISDVLSFDRFFTSVNLVHTLPFSAVGTVIKLRKNVPKFNSIWKKESLNVWQQAQVLCPGCFTPYQVLCRRCARLLSGVVSLLRCCAQDVLHHTTTEHIYEV